MAERVVEAVAPLLGRTLAASRSATATLPGGDLAGATDLEAFASATATRAALQDVPPDAAARLVATWGSDASDVARAAGDGFAPLAPDVPLSAAEVRYAIRHEMARTLTDLLERRSRLAYFATDLARAAAPAVVAIAAAELGWSASRSARELKSFTRQCDARLAWRGDPTRKETS
jgi:glycerol-3-phosphate dehydrogenase